MLLIFADIVEKQKQIKMCKMFYRNKNVSMKDKKDTRSSHKIFHPRLFLFSRSRSKTYHEKQEGLKFTRRKNDFFEDFFIRFLA